MATALDVITRALRKLGVYAAGEDPTPRTPRIALSRSTTCLRDGRSTALTLPHTTLALTDALDVPDDHLEAITLSLAERVASEFAAQISPVDAAIADQGRAAIRAYHFNIATLGIDHPRPCRAATPSNAGHQLRRGSLRSDDGNFPPLELINMFVEKAKDSRTRLRFCRAPAWPRTQRAARGRSTAYSPSPMCSAATFSPYPTGRFIAGQPAGSDRRHRPGQMGQQWHRDCPDAGRNGLLIQRHQPGRDCFPDSANVTSVTFIGSLFVFARAQRQVLLVCGRWMGEH
jgi:hypothetical protein